MKPKACINCRQQKLRCVYGNSVSCENCAKKKLSCVYDPGFRRVKRQKLAAEPEPTQTATQIEFSSSTDDINDSFQPAIHPKQLNDTVVLRPELVTELFCSYTKFCHPLFPLPISFAMEPLYKQSELLFWVICATGCTDPVLLQHLRAKVDQLKQMAIMGPAPATIETVQAFLILCSWPFPYKSVIDDISYTLSSIAVQLSLQLGFHRPKWAYDTKPQARRPHPIRTLETWMGCFIVSSREALKFGVPGFVKPDTMLLNPPFEVNPVLKDMVQLTYHLASHDQTLGNDSSVESGLMPYSSRVSLVKHFSTQLDILELEAPTDVTVSLTLMNNKIISYSYLLFDDNSPLAPDTAVYVERAIKQSILIVDTVASYTPQQFMPTLFYRYALTAALLLLKVRRDKLYTFEQPVEPTIEKTITLFEDLEKKTKSGNEYHYAAPRQLLKKLLSIEKDWKTQPQIKNRSAASLLYDSVRVVREVLPEEDQSDVVEPDCNFNEYWIDDLLRIING